MEFNPKALISISQFSKISGVSRKNLIFYDSIGLFCPEHTAENGYRYYSLRQLDTIGVIYAMKELGMPLKDIKIYLDTRTPEQMISLFSQQKQAIEREINKLKQINHMIQNRIETTTRSLKISTEKILLQQCPEEPLIISKPLNGLSTERLQEMLLDYYDFAFDHGISASYPIGAILSLETLQKKDLHNYSYYFCSPGTWFRLSRTAVKPAGLYLIGYFKGDYMNTDDTYQRLFDYMDQHGLCLDGNSYEESLLDEVCVQSPSDYLTQISIQVKQSKA